MTEVGSLFSGIGGIDLGLERAGMHVRFQVESDPFCNNVLAKHWPEVTRYGDIRNIDWATVEPVDVLAGGFPCQPVSLAGKGLGQDDSRWMWPEFVRCIRSLRPQFVLVENVPGLLGRGMGTVLGDLASCGYDAEWQCISAAAFGAPHIRDRVWIVAYAANKGTKWRQQQQEGGEGSGHVANAQCDGWQSRRPNNTTEGTKWRQPNRGNIGEVFPRTLSDSGEWPCEWPVEPDVCRVVNGIPNRVARLRGLGNAVVPQVVEWIGHRIMDHIIALTAASAASNNASEPAASRNYEKEDSA